MNLEASMRVILPLRKEPARSREVRGFSLVELMIATLIGALLLLAILQIFGSSRLSTQASLALARVQESGRFALELMKPAVRMAGLNQICTGRPRLVEHTRNGCAQGTNLLFNPELALLGWEAVGTGPGQTRVYNPDALEPATAPATGWEVRDGNQLWPLPPVLQGRVVPGSDVLVVRRVVPIPVRVTGFAGTTVQLSAPHGLPDHSVVIMSDCNVTHVFQNTSNANAAALTRPVGNCANPGPGNTPPGPNPFAPEPIVASTQIFGQEIEVFYVGREPGREPALFRMRLPVPGQVIGPGGGAAEHIQPLVDGIENMQVRYGVSFGPNAPNSSSGRAVDAWYPANQVNDWTSVIAVRVALLARSGENADSRLVSENFNLAGTVLSPEADGRLRKPFTATIQIRNVAIVE
ncbi:MAG: PilW family protein [Xanthomonadales bacterium]|nr:PilW family protein [Xanthomonadales bacterium]